MKTAPQDTTAPAVAGGGAWDRLEAELTVVLPQLSGELLFLRTPADALVVLSTDPRGEALYLDFADRTTSWTAPVPFAAVARRVVEVLRTELGVAEPAQLEYEAFLPDRVRADGRVHPLAFPTLGFRPSAMQEVALLADEFFLCWTASDRRR